jgi:hypothetical protein
LVFYRRRRRNLNRSPVPLRSHHPRGEPRLIQLAVSQRHDHRGLPSVSYDFAAASPPRTSGNPAAVTVAADVTATSTAPPARRTAPATDRASYEQCGSYYTRGASATGRSLVPSTMMNAAEFVQISTARYVASISEWVASDCLPIQVEVI